MRFYPKNIFIMMQKSSKITALAFSMWSGIKLSNQQIWKPPHKKISRHFMWQKSRKKGGNSKYFFDYHSGRPSKSVSCWLNVRKHLHMCIHKAWYLCMWGKKRIGNNIILGWFKQFWTVHKAKARRDVALRAFSSTFCMWTDFLFLLRFQR